MADKVKSGVTPFSWPEACEFCKGYPLPPGSDCTCEPVSIWHKYAGLNPVAGKPTSPERPSNKPNLRVGDHVEFDWDSDGDIERGVITSIDFGSLVRPDWYVVTDSTGRTRRFMEMHLTRIPTPGSYDDRQPRPADPVNHPSHYTAGGIETIDAIEAALTAEEFRGYCKGNALKYVWREKHKGQNESLRKAIWYLNRLVNDR